MRPVEENDGQENNTIASIARKRASLGLDWSAVIQEAVHAPQAQKRQPEERWVELHEGTNICATVSPDGSSLALDLLGVLWTLPISGGEASPISDEFADATQPDWSPDGKTIVFQSYRSGNFHIWQVDADGTNLRQLTTGPFDHREPRFSPDGTQIAFSSDREGSYGIYVLNLTSGLVTVWANSTSEEATPAWSPDGTRLAFTVDGVAIDSVDAAGGRRRHAKVDDALVYAPSWSPDGLDVAYIVFDGQLPGPFGFGPTRLVVEGNTVSSKDEDVFPFRAVWLSAREVLYTADGGIRRRNLATGAVADVEFTARARVTARRELPRQQKRTDERSPMGIVGPALSPDASKIAFCALGDMWLTPVDGGQPQRLTRHSFVTDPAWSPDNRFLAYTSDRSGNPDIWIRELSTGAERRLTACGFAAVAAAWSPDGTRIAFQDHEGATYVADVETSQVSKVLGPMWQPGRPTWSPDGAVLAFAAVQPSSRRFREGFNQILTLDLRTGKTTHFDPSPHRSLSTRGYDGPVWSPDGSRMAFVMGSTLWVIQVDSTGRPAGPARRLTHEVTDAPTWSGDSARLLYLSQGRLRLIPAGGGPAKTIPIAWPRIRTSSPKRTIIHAGRLWDGESQGLRENVAIVVEGDRIVDVGRRSEIRDGQVIDASNLTVMPGLADMHVHPHMRGKFFGSRQGRIWLAFGITTIRSPGDPVYQALEEREAIKACRRIGPRYFGTGEAIDGSRVYYNFMRPTTPDDLELELSRVDGFDYDLVKTYVRLPITSQRTAIQRAHRNGRWVTSHYLYPAALLGMDGVEHLFGSNRLGYSQTMTRRARAYDDVVTIFGETGMSITPTLSIASVLLANDDSWLIDRRIRALYPPWELEALAQKANLVKSSPAVTERLRTALASQVSVVQRIMNRGGLVINGTDAPIDHTAVGTHLNLRAMVAHGISPYDTLRTATHNAAIVLGAENELGKVQPGFLADLIFVEGDPLRDITSVAKVRKVMAQGVLHDVDDLLTPVHDDLSATGHDPAAHIIDARKRHYSNELIGQRLPTTGCC
ncbi:amidohydrolase family protein [Arthrobacter bambusae]|uniref:Tol biopolymer transport system component n=1 Tax=Arthrobacter bambusae TaxID=1338426 RepID=A0AAW8DB94_9MICC|nr:amidohydrolase family protein [Arthrobacter bambusae]MDP9906176.1 Tol biopolymer transport system component [Arthrobacter bambusae]MDQ0130591.1 Tol biopolymer transport system component [Arthrobacter bambusae]MDQ0182266.1 Tol biopolymer transport system component [Arthrobacter bambusae]